MKELNCRGKQKTRVLVAQWIERPSGVREVMGSNPIGTKIFSRSHVRVTLFSHIFTELQFYHYSVVITASLFSYFLSALPLPKCITTEQSIVEASLIVL